MFDQLIIRTMALKTNTCNSKREENKIEGANKSSAILEKFCMHVAENRSQDRTSRNPNINVLPYSEIEKIKTRLDQKLHGAQKHPPVGHGSSKINELSSILQPVSRFSFQDFVVRTRSLHVRDHNSVQVSDRSVSSGSKRRHLDRVVKKEKKACPRCGRWCKYDCRGASSSLVVVCVNCGKRFQFQPNKKELDKSRY